MFGRGKGKRRSSDRIAQLTAEVRNLRSERDEAERGELAAVRARDALAEMLLKEQIKTVRLADEMALIRRQATAANVRADELEKTLQEVRGHNDDLRDNTVTQPLPIPALVVGEVPAAPTSVLPRLPEWARQKGFTYSRSNGFGMLPTPGPSVKPIALQQAAAEGKLA